MSIDRQVQLTGVRRWWGDDLQSLQDSLWNAFEQKFLGEIHDNLILTRPTIDPSTNSITKRGYVIMNGADGRRFCEISGENGGPYTTVDNKLYMKQDLVDTETRVYTDSGATKAVKQIYVAKGQSEVPATPYIYMDLSNLKFYDDSGNEILEFSDYFIKKSVAEDSSLNSIDASTLQGTLLADLLTKAEGYTKIQANNNTQSDIDASKLGGTLASDFYTKAQANSSYNNSIDANTLGTISPSSFLLISDANDHTQNAIDAAKVDGQNIIPKTTIQENISDGSGNTADLYFTAIGNDTTGYQVTIYARMDSGFNNTIVSIVNLPARYRPSSTAKAGDSAFYRIIVNPSDIIILNDSSVGQKSVTYHTEI